MRNHIFNWRKKFCYLSKRNNAGIFVLLLLYGLLQEVHLCLDWAYFAFMSQLLLDIFFFISMYCFLTNLLKHFLVYYIFSHVFNLCFMYTLNCLIPTSALALSRNFRWLSKVYVYSLLIVSYSFECLRLYLF